MSDIDIPWGPILIVGVIILVIVGFTPIGSVNQNCSSTEFQCDETELTIHNSGVIHTGQSATITSFDKTETETEWSDSVDYFVATNTPESENYHTITVQFTFIDDNGETIETETERFKTGTDSDTISLDKDSYPFVEEVQYEVISVNQFRYKYYLSQF